MTVVIMIPLMIPDLPTTDDIIPWLHQIDQNKWYSNYGPLSKQFEREIVELLEAENSGAPASGMVSTSSGTSALEVALSAYRLRPGSKVLLPSLTFPATATAVIRCGLIPVFTDVDPNSWVLTPDIAESVIKKCDADVVIPVSAYGVKIPEKPWQQFAHKHQCKVLIDAAGAFPGQVAMEGVDVTYSFHATKCLGIGEGGGIVSVNNAFLDCCREVTNFGFSQGTIHTSGINAKLSEYHAAVGLCQIRRFKSTMLKRIKLRNKYVAGFSQSDNAVVFQEGKTAISPTLFVVSVPNKASACVKRLTEQGIGVRQWYCPPLHRHKAFASYLRNLSLKYGDLSISDYLGESLVGLPFHPFLTDAQITTVVNAVIEVANNKQNNNKQAAPTRAFV